MLGAAGGIGGAISSVVEFAKSHLGGGGDNGGSSGTSSSGDGDSSSGSPLVSVASATVMASEPTIVAAVVEVVRDNEEDAGVREARRATAAGAARLGSGDTGPDPAVHAAVRAVWAGTDNAQVVQADFRPRSGPAMEVLRNDRFLEGGGGGGGASGPGVSVGGLLAGAAKATVDAMGGAVSDAWDWATEADEDQPAAWAELDAAGETVRDDTCAPEGHEGHWEGVVRPQGTSAQAAAMDYQRQVTRTLDLPGSLEIEYRVTDPQTGATALFDGCAHWSPEGELLEAKRGYGGIFDLAEQGKGFAVRVGIGLAAQVDKQALAAGPTHPVEWHVSDAAQVGRFESIVREGGGANFSVVHTPDANRP